MKIVVIGSSTGGPYILEQIFSGFPIIRAAIIIVQHLPPNFTEAFRGHIDVLTQMKVSIAQPVSQISEGEIFIAPAGKHMLLSHNRSILMNDGDKLHGVKPAVDHTMLSLQRRPDDMLAGVVLTGMGEDGAQGIVHIRELGGLTIAQDPATSPIKSMPQSAIDTGKINEILTPDAIKRALIRFGS